MSPLRPISRIIETHIVKEATSRVIKMDVDDADALRHLLRYIYTANIDELVAEADHKDNYDFLDHLLDVFLLADKYDLPTLSELLVEAFQDVKVYWEASQAVRAYVRIIQLPKGITARRQLTDAAIAKVTGPDLRWNDLNPAERNAAREEPDSAEPGPGEESIASAVTAVAENPEAALYIMSQLGSMLNLAQATMLDRYYASAIVPLSQADTTSEPDDDNMTTDESDSDDDDEAGFTADNDPALNIEMIFEEDEIDTDAEDADYVESDSDDEEVLDVVVIE